LLFLPIRKREGVYQRNQHSLSRKENLTKSILASPKLLVCMDCGLADVLLSEDELRNLKETYSSCSREILADMECESSPIPLGSGFNE
jgi:hypothetical protein